MMQLDVMQNLLDGAIRQNDSVVVRNIEQQAIGATQILGELARRGQVDLRADLERCERIRNKALSVLGDIRTT